MAARTRTRRASRPGVALVVALTLSLAACGDSGVAAGSADPGLDAAAEAPLDRGPVPPFALTSQLGEEVTLATLKGRPFVMAAIFTTCSGPCPRITAHMRALQEELADTDVRLVSISVDPGHDTPEVLRAYAEAYTADPARWLFLTGEEKAVIELVQGGFWLSAVRDDDAPFGEQVTHMTKLVAVDRRGHRRGWYDSDEDGVRALAERMRFLARER